jgi:hypothetical protein
MDYILDVGKLIIEKKKMINYIPQRRTDQTNKIKKRLLFLVAHV